MKRTRIKICGLTRLEDVELALELGADALGFVLWPGSPRHVMVEELKHLTAHLPAFAKSVGLVVNGQRETIQALLSEVPLDLLQFHGDESAAECEGYRINYLRAARMSAGLDLLEFEKSYPGARALLLDAHTPSYGGSGKVFDWSLIPAELAPRVVLSGGLNAQNVAEAIQRVRPFAVDVSSGVEAAPGIKDKERMRHFFLEVARADQTI